MNKWNVPERPRRTPETVFRRESLAAIRLSMHACQESGIAGVLADGVEEWVHADECHVEAMTVESVLERVKGMIEIVGSKIIDADLISGARVG